MDECPDFRRATPWRNEKQQERIQVKERSSLTNLRACEPSCPAANPPVGLMHTRGCCGPVPHARLQTLGILKTESDAASATVHPGAKWPVGESVSGDNGDRCLARQSRGCREKPRPAGHSGAVVGSLKQRREAAAGLTPESTGDTSWVTQPNTWQELETLKASWESSSGWCE